MKEKMKNFGCKMAVALPACAVAFPAVAFAEGTSVADTMGTALTGMQTDFVAVVAVVAVPALAIYAVPKIWKLGLRFFNAITGKG